MSKKDNLYTTECLIFLITFLSGGGSYFLWSINKYFLSVLVCVIVSVPVFIRITIKTLKEEKKND